MWIHVMFRYFPISSKPIYVGILVQWVWKCNWHVNFVLPSRNYGNSDTTWMQQKWYRPVFVMIMFYKCRLYDLPVKWSIIGCSGGCQRNQPAVHESISVHLLNCCVLISIFGWNLIGQKWLDENYSSNYCNNQSVPKPSE